MKKLFALLLALCLLCSSAFALADNDLIGNLGWEAADDEHTVLTDEIREKVMKALQDFKEGTVEPFLVLAIQPSTADSDESDISESSKSKLDSSMDSFLKTLGTETTVLSTSYVHGNDLCVLCRVTPKEKDKAMYWMMAFISYGGKLLGTVNLNVSLSD